MNSFRNMKSSNIKEDGVAAGGSQTGTGASFTPGSGEQYATNRAFRKKKKKLSEEVSYTPEKREQLYSSFEKAYDKYKSDVERYINVFKGFSIEELMSSDQKALKIKSEGEALERKFNLAERTLDNIAYQYDEEEDSVNFKKCMDLSNKYGAIKDSCYYIVDGIGDILEVINKVKEHIK